jgi:predicted transcriptional regulator
MATKVLNVRVPEEQADQLDSLAKVMRQTRSKLLTEAIHQYLQVNQSQVEYIEAAMERSKSPLSATLSRAEMVGRVVRDKRAMPAPSQKEPSAPSGAKARRKRV